MYFQTAAATAAPAAPTGLGATTISSSRIDLSWSAPSGTVSNYKIYRGTSSGGESLYYTTSTAGTTFQNSDNVLCGTTYYYKVTAVNSGGESAYSNEASATSSACPASAPGAPTNLAATTISSTRIDLSWTAPSSNGGASITSYRIYRGTSSGSLSVYATTNTAGTTFENSANVDPSTTYYYKVAAITSVGEGTQSNLASATSSAPAATVPGAPTNLVATTMSSTRIDLSWTAPSSNGGASIMSYRVYRGTSSGSLSAYATTNTAGTTFENSANVDPSTTYYYKVAAINSVGEGTQSSQAQATSSAPAATAPGAPTGLTATTISSSRIDLSWTAPSSNGGASITSYRIYRGTSSGSLSAYATTNTAGVSFENSANVDPSTTYYYKVAATNSAGEGSQSNQAQATSSAPAATVPGAPTGLTATTISSSRIDLAWTAPSSNGGASITSYRIYRGTSSGSLSEYATTNTAGVTFENSANVDPSTTYYYKVAAINSAGEGSQSNLASAASSAPAATVPGAPTSLIATTMSSTRIDLSWIAPSSNGGASITGYRIYRGTSSGSLSVYATTNTAGTTFENSANVDPSTTYYYKVAAINSVGEGTQSNLASATSSAPAATVPGAPTNLVATTMSSTRIDLSWTAPSSNGGASITSYRVYRGASSGGLSQYATTSTASVTFENSANVDPSTTYYYKVAAINSAGEGTQSNLASATSSAPAATVPGAPTNLAATTISSTRIDLSWTAPSSNGGASITSYRIYRGTSSNSLQSYATTNTAGVTFENSANVDPSTTYYYKVAAINSAGEGSQSNLASATSSTPSATVPGAPTNLAATTVSSTRIDLSWTVPSSNGGATITSYRIYRGTSSGSLSQYATTNTAGVTFENSANVDPSTTYYYKVAAINSAGEGSRSNLASATSSASTATVPGAPTNLAATTISSTRIDLSWTAPSNNGGASITSYRIYRGTSSSNLQAYATTNTAGVTFENSANVDPSTTYYYKVAAINSAGEGSQSNLASAMSSAPAATVPGAPTNLVATAMSSTRIDLSWTAPSSNGGATITSYRIYRGTSSGSLSAYATTNTVGVTFENSANVNPSTTYYYKVAAISSVGEGSQSNLASATSSAPAATAPGVPTNLVATTVSSTRIDLSWTAPSSNGGASVNNYRVYRGTSSGSLSAYATTNTAGVTFENSANVDPSTTYYYKVAAINTVGEGPQSNLASATSNAPAATAPGAPANLVATVVSSMRIDLSWTAPSSNGGASITSYRIYRGTSSGSLSAYATTNTAGVTFENSANVEPSTTYYYKVAAINSVGEGSQSSHASATSSAPVAPVATTGSASSITTTSAILNGHVNPNGQATSAYFQYGTSTSYGSETSTSTLGSGPTGQSVTAPITGLTAGTTYHFRIAATYGSNTAYGLDQTFTANSNPQPRIDSVSPNPMTASTSLTRITVTGANFVEGTGADLKFTDPQNNPYLASAYPHRYRSVSGTRWQSDMNNLGATGRWTVQVINPDGQTSTPYEFTVQAGALTTSPTPNSPGSSSSPGTTETTRRPTFSWSSVSGATSYNLYVSKAPYGEANQVIAEHDITTTSYTPTSSEQLADNTAYRWTVSASNSAGEGQYSTNYLYFRVQASALPRSVPASPSELKASAVAVNEIRLTWKVPPSASPITDYKIYRSAAVSTFPELITSPEAIHEVISASEGGFVNRGARVECGTTYAYRVRAVSIDGDGALSETASATTAPCSTVKDVRIRVVNAKTGDSIQGATVVGLLGLGAQATTDTQGEFNAADLLRTPQVFVSAPGYVRLQTTLPAIIPAGHEIELIPLAQLAGRVVGEDGAVVSFAEVTAGDTRTTTDSEGSFTIRDLPPDEGTFLVVEAPNFRTYTNVVIPSKMPTLDVILKPGSPESQHSFQDTVDFLYAAWWGALLGEGGIGIPETGYESPGYLAGWLGVGTAPVIGNVADARDTLITAWEGDWPSTALNAFATIPVAGALGDFSQIAKSSAKWAKATGKYADAVAPLLKAARGDPVALSDALKPLKAKPYDIDKFSMTAAEAFYRENPKLVLNVAGDSKALSESTKNLVADMRIVASRRFFEANPGLIDEVADAWDKGTFPTKGESIAYHWGKHADGQSLKEFTADAVAYWQDNKALAQWGTWTPGWGPSFKIEVYGHKSYYTADGKILTFFEMQ